MIQVKYPAGDQEFSAELRRRINQYFKDNKLSHHAPRRYFFKIIFFFLLYAIIYLCLFYARSFSMLLSYFALLGILGVILGINVGHDAAHEVIFRKKSANLFLLYVFELLGTSSYNWKNRHLGAHHLFPNVSGHDSDIQQSKIVKIFPNDTWKPFHAFQHIYMPVLYSIYLLRWVLYRDLRDVFTKRIGVFDNSDYPPLEFAKLLLFKLAFFTYMVLVPAFYTGFNIGEVICGFLIYTIAGSILMTFVLLSTHVGEHSHFPEPDANGVLPYSWIRHQFETTSDFAPKSVFLTQIFGAFNHHVIHHLYPNFSHMHYPAMTSILEKTALEYGLPYKSADSVFISVASHFTLLRNNAREKHSEILAEVLNS